MLEAGKLDRRVTLLRSTTTTDDFGGEVHAWEEAGKVWASKQDVRDAERYSAAETGATVTTRFQVRSSSLTRSIDARWRLQCDGLEYEIDAVKEIGRREGVEITAAARAER